MKAPYDDLNFVRELSKYKWCRANLTVIKRFLLTDWSVYGKISVKSRKIGKMNTLKSQKKKKKGYKTEKSLNMESDQPEIKVIAPLNEIPPPPTTENIMKTLNNDKEPDENNEVVLTTNIKDVDEREVVTGDMEAFEPDAEGNDLLEFNTDMVLESIDAQGGEAKGLLDGEFTELIPDKGGGNEKTVRECLKT